MNLTFATRLWFEKLREVMCSWFDFGVDLIGLDFTEDDLDVDLATGRD